MSIRRNFGRFGITLTAMIGLLGSILGPGVARSTGRPETAGDAHHDLLVGVAVDEKNWEPRIRRELKDAGYEDKADEIVALLQESQARLMWEDAHRDQYVSAAPPVADLAEQSNVSNTSQYVGCTVGQAGYALLTVFDPTSVVVYWTGLKLVPPFTYIAGPLFQTYNASSCVFLTSEQGAARFSHSVSATVDTDVQITNWWCG